MVGRGEAILPDLWEALILWLDSLRRALFQGTVHEACFPDTDETKFFNSDTSPRLIILPSRDRDRFRDSEYVQIETESETNTMK